MIAHYVTVALRSFRRQKLHALLGIVSLALGLACFVAAYVAVAYLGSSDSQFAKAQRTYAIYQSNRSPGGTRSTLSPFSAPALAEQLAIDVPQIEVVARATRIGNIVAVGDQRRFQPLLAASREFLDVFDLTFLAGDSANALQHGTAIVTEPAAIELFGTRDAIGRVVEVGNGIQLTITGVIAPIPAPTHLGNSLFGGGPRWLVPMHVREELYPMIARNPPWAIQGDLTYALLPADGSFTVRDLNASLASFSDRHVPKDFGTIELEARHISRIAIDFFQLLSLEQTVGVMSVPAMLLSLGSLALGIAVLNFVNLATAQAVRRAREVGIRKVLGSSPARVARQYLVETGVAVLAAFAIAAAIVAAAAFELARRSVNIDFAKLDVGELTAFTLLVIAGVTLAAGAYPALILARARTIQTLVTGALRGGSERLRNVLVGTQFAAAGLLLLAVLVMYGQHAQLERNALPRSGDAFVSIFAPFGGNGPSYETFAAEVTQSPRVVGITTAGMPPWSIAVGGSAAPMARSQEAAVEAIAVQVRLVGYDYFETLAMDLVAGRSFARNRQDETPLRPPEETPERRVEPARVVLDRVAAERFGWSDPRAAVGQLLYGGGDRARVSEIIGVAESLPLTLGGGAEGFVYQLAPGVANSVIVRLARDTVAEGVADIQDVWNRLAPGLPFNRMFLDDGFRNAYGTFASVNRLFVGLTLFVFFIASAGLFGIASYRVRVRLHEIGVRKVVGASPLQIMRLMLWDFAKPVLIANVLVWPLGLIAMQSYLAMFVQRMPLTPLPFVVSLALALAIAWLAAGVHVAAATRVEPARVLRNE